MTTTVKIVPVTAPKAAPVVAVQVQARTDHPALAVSALGGMQLTTASGVVVVNPGDYVIPDGNGGYKCVPAIFLPLLYLTQ
jgi:regulator of RNase E activity RraA